MIVLWVALWLAMNPPIASWAEALEGRTVALPEGGVVALFGPPGTSLLDDARLATCLTTLEEAGVWPEAWLVVVDRARPYDVAVALRSAESGAEVLEAFAAPREEWDVEGLRRAARDVLGRKPRARVESVVVQEFSRRVVDRYPYAPPPADARQGLLGVVPPGAVLRDAASIDLLDGEPHTLAIVLRSGEFVPGRCGREGVSGYDVHADIGQFEIVVTDARSVLGSLDLSAWYQGATGERLALARFPCAEGDGVGAIDPAAVRGWIHERAAVAVLAVRDLDGDGRSLESRIMTADGRSFEVGVDPLSRAPFAR